MRIRDLAIDYVYGLPLKVLSKHSRDAVVGASHAIVEAYLQEIVSRRLVTDRISKVVVSLFPDNLPKLLEDSLPKEALGVALVTHPFAFQQFMKSNREQRRWMLLEALHDGVVAAARNCHFDPTPFPEIRESVIKAGLVYRRVLGKPKWNRERSRCAEICLYGDIGVGHAHLLVMESTGQIRALRLQQGRYPPTRPIEDKWVGRWRGNASLSIWAEHHSFVRSEREKCLFKAIDVRELRRLDEKNEELRPFADSMRGLLRTRRGSRTRGRRPVHPENSIRDEESP